MRAVAAIPRDGTLSNVWAADHTHTLAGGTIVLALDMYEHSYALDFGANADAYVEAFMANIAWERIARRFAGTAPAVRPHTIDTQAARRLMESDPNIFVIDARLADDAASVPVRLPRARRAPPNQVDADCAAKLRERGIDAVAVAGGIGTWRADGLPTEPLKEGEPS